MTLTYPRIGFSLVTLFLTLLLASPAHAATCPSLTRTLTLGMRDSSTGGEVTRLQTFLAEYYDLDHDEYVSGFFGVKTRENVRKFQCEKIGVCSGSEGSNGYGVVGPKTRAAIQEACGGASPGDIPTQTSTTTDPDNRPPLVSRFDGPSSLKVNEVGTWRVTAADPDNQQLSYNIMWGDENEVLATLLEYANLTNFTTATTFTHSYERSGAYEVVLRVRDGAGGEVRIVTLVSVGNADTGAGFDGDVNYCEQDQFVCADGSRVRRSGPYCQFVCPFFDSENTNTNLCMYNYRYYEEDAVRTANSCEGDIRNFNPINCAPITFICKDGEWLRKFNSSCVYSGERYPDGSRHPLGVEGSDMEHTFCDNGEWITRNLSTSCRYQGETYYHGDSVQCSGTISGDQYCVRSEEQWNWPYQNVCRNGRWLLEAI